MLGMQRNRSPEPDWEGSVHRQTEPLRFRSTMHIPEPGLPNSKGINRPVALHILIKFPELSESEGYIQTFSAAKGSYVPQKLKPFLCYKFKPLKSRKKLNYQLPILHHKPQKILTHTKPKTSIPITSQLFTKLNQLPLTFVFFLLSNN